MSDQTLASPVNCEKDTLLFEAAFLGGNREFAQDASFGIT